MRKRPMARFIRPAAWHEEFLAWLAAGLGPQAASKEVGKHPTRAMQVRWVDADFKERWLSIMRMRVDEDAKAMLARLTAIYERRAEKVAILQARSALDGSDQEKRDDGWEE